MDVYRDGSLVFAPDTSVDDDEVSDLEHDTLLSSAAVVSVKKIERDLCFKMYVYSFYCIHNVSLTVSDRW